MLGMSCADCHMAKVADATGKSKPSHWLTSPLKNNITMCGKCHNDVQADLFTCQDVFYAKARSIEDTLFTVLQKIDAANTSGLVPASDLAEAKALYMRALTWWEWTAVSENSMGSHNGSEMNIQLDQAKAFAEQALSKLP